MICLIFITDGRDCAKDAFASAQQHLPKPDQLVYVDDSDHERGFHGAVQAAWDLVPDEAEYVFHLEDDFIFQQEVPIDDMLWLLDNKPWLAQVSLKRQAVNEEEKAAGGIVEAHPDDFEERHENEISYTVQRRYFTTNPCLYRANLVKRGWPQVPNSEGVFTHQLLDDDFSFAIYGEKFAAPMVEHVGIRQGKGY
jgi:hypothetical protein